MRVIDESWVPARAVHPLEILQEELKARGIKQKDFAKTLGMQASNLSRMIKNREEVSTTLALKLEGALGIPARHWTSLQEQYLRDLKAIDEAERAELVASQEWQQIDKCFNLEELCKRIGIKAYLSVRQRLEALRDRGLDLHQFRLGLSIAGGCFKRSTKLELDERNLHTWILLAQWGAKACTCAPYQVERLDECAQQVSSLAHSGEANLERMTALLASYGIALVYVPILGKTPIDGYSSQQGNRAMIAVSLRRNDMDRFAFDVLHELGHLKLHLSQEGRATSYISIEDYSSQSKDEQEANRYAERALISDTLWDKLCRRHSVSNISPHRIANEIAERARSLGLSPSIALWRYKYQAQVYNIAGHSSPKLFT